MSITDLIGPHLPYLRRFARALSGSQESGDAYVVATLETLVATGRRCETDLDPKVALYQIFLSIWNGAPINGKPPLRVDHDAKLEQSDAAIAPGLPADRGGGVLPGRCRGHHAPRRRRIRALARRRHARSPSRWRPTC